MRVRSIVAKIAHVITGRARLAPVAGMVAEVFGGEPDTNVPTNGEALLRWVARMEGRSYDALCRYYLTTPTHLFRTSVVLDEILARFGGKRAPSQDVLRALKDWIIAATNNKYVETYE